MANASKRKGDRAELEVQALWRDHTGYGRRALGAGRKDDVGDIHGVPLTVIQVTNQRDVAHAVRHKPIECEQQRERAQEPFAATFVRLKGGDWRVVMTVEQYFAYFRESQP